jgi:hypothetical protein
MPCDQWTFVQPGHQPVCQRQIRDIKALGLASAFFRIAQVSQGKVFSDEDVRLGFMIFSFLIQVNSDRFDFVSLS